MERIEPFANGSAVVWRSRPKGDIGFVYCCRVLVDHPRVMAVVQPPGAPVVRRVGKRGGPNGRSLLPGTWDGSRQMAAWGGPPAIRLHPVGRSYSVIRSWIAGDAHFSGWYVNLEQPWSRTTVGFDSRDDVLDVVVSDDLSECRLKDEDELEFAVEVKQLTAGDARSIRAAAQSVIADVAARRWPFEESAWRASPLLDDRRVLRLPDGWDEP